MTNTEIKQLIELGRSLDRHHSNIHQFSKMLNGRFLNAAGKEACQKKIALAQLSCTEALALMKKILTSEEASV
jgi:hypothetical protein